MVCTNTASSLRFALMIAIASVASVACGGSSAESLKAKGGKSTTSGGDGSTDSGNGSLTGPSGPSATGPTSPTAPEVPVDPPAEPDTAAPQVVTAPNGSNVPFGALTVVFSEALDEDSLVAPLTVSDGIEGDVIYDESTFSLTLVPAVTTVWRAGKSYTGTLSPSITDVAGNAIAPNDLSFTFNAQTVGPILVDQGHARARITASATTRTVTGETVAVWMGLSGWAYAHRASDSASFGAAIELPALPDDIFLEQVKVFSLVSGPVVLTAIGNGGVFACTLSSDLQTPTCSPIFSGDESTGLSGAIASRSQVVAYQVANDLQLHERHLGASGVWSADNALGDAELFDYIINESASDDSVMLAYDDQSSGASRLTTAWLLNDVWTVEVVNDSLPGSSLSSFDCALSDTPLGTRRVCLWGLYAAVGYGLHGAATDLEDGNNNMDRDEWIQTQTITPCPPEASDSDYCGALQVAVTSVNGQYSAIWARAESDHQYTVGGALSDSAAGFSPIGIFFRSSQFAFVAAGAGEGPRSPMALVFATRDGSNASNLYAHNVFASVDDGLVEEGPLQLLESASDVPLFPSVPTFAPYASSSGSANQGIAVAYAYEGRDGALRAVVRTATAELPSYAHRLQLADHANSSHMSLSLSRGALLAIGQIEDSLSVLTGDGIEVVAGASKPGFVRNPSVYTVPSGETLVEWTEERGRSMDHLVAVVKNGAVADRRVLHHQNGFNEVTNSTGLANGRLFVTTKNEGVEVQPFIDGRFTAPVRLPLASVALSADPQHLTLMTVQQASTPDFASTARVSFREWTGQGFSAPQHFDRYFPNTGNVSDSAVCASDNQLTGVAIVSTGASRNLVVYSRVNGVWAQPQQLNTRPAYFSPRCSVVDGNHIVSWIDDQEDLVRVVNAASADLNAAQSIIGGASVTNVKLFKSGTRLWITGRETSNVLHSATCALDGSDCDAFTATPITASGYDVLPNSNGFTVLFSLAGVRQERAYVDGEGWQAAVSAPSGIGGTQSGDIVTADRSAFLRKTSGQALLHTRSNTGGYSSVSLGSAPGLHAFTGGSATTLNENRVSAVWIDKVDDEDLLEQARVRLVEGY